MTRTENARKRFVEAIYGLALWMREEQGGEILQTGYKFLKSAVFAFADAECADLCKGSIIHGVPHDVCRDELWGEVSRRID